MPPNFADSRGEDSFKNRLSVIPTEPHSLVQGRQYKKATKLVAMDSFDGGLQLLHTDAENPSTPRSFPPPHAGLLKSL